MTAKIILSIFIFSLCTVKTFAFDPAGLYKGTLEEKYLIDEDTSTIFLNMESGEKYELLIPQSKEYVARYLIGHLVEIEGLKILRTLPNGSKKWFIDVIAIEPLEIYAF